MYTGRDIVNQAFKNLDKTAPVLIQNLKGELNDVFQQRVYQVITWGGAQRKEVGPQLLKGNFGKKKLTEAKQQLNRELDKLKKHVKI